MKKKGNKKRMAHRLLAVALSLVVVGASLIIPDDSFSAEETYEIVLNTNGGTYKGVATPDVITYSESTETFTIDEAVKTNATFRGWYENGDKTNLKKTITVEKGSSGNHEYTALYSTSVTIYADGGSFRDGSDTKTFDVEDDSLSLKEAFDKGYLVKPSKEDYSIAHWVDADDAVIYEDNLVNTVCGKTIRPVWVNYTITLILNGGSLPSDTSSSIVYTQDSETFLLPQPTKTGFVFNGWYETDEEDAVKELQITKGSTGNRTYKASWDEEFTITYELNGADSSPANPTTYSAKTPRFQLINPVRDGYTFKGWTADFLTGYPQAVTIDGSVNTGNLKLVANWYPSAEDQINTANGRQWKISYTGSGQYFIAPKDGYYCYELWGAGNIPAYRGYTRAYEYLHAGDKRYVYVGGIEADSNYKEGGKTFNGGGIDKNGLGINGGGATDIRKQDRVMEWFDEESKSDDHLIAVAGGGSGGILNTEGYAEYQDPREAGIFYYTFYDDTAVNRDEFLKADIFNNSFCGEDGEFRYNLKDVNGDIYEGDELFYFGGFGAGYKGASFDNEHVNTGDLIYSLTGQNHINTKLVNSHGLDFMSDDYAGRDVPFTSIYNDKFLLKAFELENENRDSLLKLHTDDTVYGGGIDIASFGTMNYEYAVENGWISDDGNGFAYITYMEDCSEEDLNRSVPTSLTFEIDNGHIGASNNTSLTFDFGLQGISLSTLEDFVLSKYGMPIHDNTSMKFDKWDTTAYYGENNALSVPVENMISVEGNTALGYENVNRFTIKAVWKETPIEVSLIKEALSMNGENYTDIVPTNNADAIVTLKASAVYADTKSSVGDVYYGLYYKEYADTNGDNQNEGTYIKISEFIAPDGADGFVRFPVTIREGNGTYVVKIARDSNPSENDIITVSNDCLVTVFDIEAPTLALTDVVIKDSDIITRSKDVVVTGHEGITSKSNIAFNKLYYFFEKYDERNPRTNFDNVKWQNTGAIKLTENGTYIVYVKDEVGNIAYMDSVDGKVYGTVFVISQVDESSPVITFDKEKRVTHDSGKVIFYGIKVTDDNGVDELSYGAYDNIHKKALTIQTNENDTSDAFLKRTASLVLSNGYNIATVDVDLTPTLNADKKVTSTWFYFMLTEDVDFTLKATDKCGNESNILHVVEKVADYSITTEDGYRLIDGTGYIRITPNTTDWVHTSVVLTPFIKNLDYEESEPCILWKNTTDKITNASKESWKKITENTCVASTNSTYMVYVKCKDKKIYYASYDVKNIDNILPIVKSKSLSADGTKLNLTLYDGESGLKYVSVNGGSFEKITELALSGNEKEVSVPVSKSGEYTIFVGDNCGNVADYVYSLIIVEQENKTPASTDTANDHVVNFATYSGGIVKSEVVPHHGSATPPSSLSRAGYTFEGWDASYANVTEDRTIHAVWSKIDNGEASEFYVVTFTNYDDSVIKAEKVADGGTATPPAVTREGYVLSGWSNSYANVHKDVTCKAIFVEKEASSNTNKTNGGGYGGGTTTTKTTNNTTDTKDKNDKYMATVSGNSANETNDLNAEETSLETEEQEFASGTVLTLTEFSDEAIMLSKSYEDNNHSTVVSQSERFEGEEQDETQFVTELLENEGEVESTEAMESSNGASGKQVMAVILLVALGGAVAFYFLNKKFFWVTLPF